LDRLVSLPRQVRDSLSWWKDPHIICTGVLVIQPAPAITIITCIFVELGASRDTYHSRQMVYPAS
ncbi:hypothetical protein KIL84_011937, partial [Mauremys mutica]